MQDEKSILYYLIISFQEQVTIPPTTNPTACHRHVDTLPMRVVVEELALVVLPIGHKKYAVAVLEIASEFA